MTAPSARAPEVLDALGDVHRRRILEILGGRAQPVGRIADQLPISRPAVSRHLRLLSEAGLVGHRAEGTRHVYELRPEGVAAVQDYFRSLWGEAIGRFTLLAENTAENLIESDGDD
jgi:DNA-binding transcriptional ArsR family regulator